MGKILEVLLRVIDGTQWRTACRVAVSVILPFLGCRACAGSHSDSCARDRAQACQAVNAGFIDGTQAFCTLYPVGFYGLYLSAVNGYRLQAAVGVGRGEDKGACALRHVDKDVVAFHEVKERTCHCHIVLLNDGAFRIQETCSDGSIVQSGPSHLLHTLNVQLIGVVVRGGRQDSCTLQSAAAFCDVANHDSNILLQQNSGKRCPADGACR